MDVNALNYRINKAEHISYNNIKTIFYNTKTQRRINVVENSRSFGIWIGRKFLPLSKIEHEKELKEVHRTDDLNYILSQF